MQQVLSLFELTEYQGTVVIRATIDRDHPIVAHFLSIRIERQDGVLASLDPWHDINFRCSNIEGSTYRIVGITELDEIPLTDWTEAK